MAVQSRRQVFVAGTGVHPFGRFKEKTLADLSELAIEQALEDAGIGFKDIDLAYYCHLLYQGASAGQAVLGKFGATGLPIINLENACSSGTTGVWQGYWAVASGQVDCVLVVGAEEVPSGPVSTGSGADLVGDDNASARYALRTSAYMSKWGAPIDAFAEIAVKARHNASLNPNATHKRPMTRDEVLAGRLIASPLSVYQLCPNADGAGAAILMSEDMLKRTAGANRSSWTTIDGVGLASEMFHSKTVENPNSTQLAAQQAYELAGVTPAQIGVAQVHDASTVGEVLALENLGLVPSGAGWKAALNGETALDGALPVNTDGGLLGLGHPFGATGLRMLHETNLQLTRRSPNNVSVPPSHGVIQCAGANGVSTVIVCGTQTGYAT